MKSAHKLIITALGSALLAGTGTLALTADSMEVTAVKTEKSAILKDNIWLSARLGEAPTLDLSVVSAEEMTAAYIATVNEKQADEKELNLLTALTDRATVLGVSCITK